MAQYGTSNEGPKLATSKHGPKVLNYFADCSDRSEQLFPINLKLNVNLAAPLGGGKKSVALSVHLDSLFSSTHPTERGPWQAHLPSYCHGTTRMRSDPAVKHPGRMTG
ncbi:hypothetical protein MMC14_007097 [Varicellaria rhodocarpa]|nr:hypothetical protein [Varicellaria rhodocarpa]